jgi:hypothetical protein
MTRRNAAMQVESTAMQGIKIYWRCGPCYARGLTPALEAKLSRHGEVGS